MDHTAELGGAELALCRLLPALAEFADIGVLLLAHGPLEERLRAAGVAVSVVPLPSALVELNRLEAGNSPRRIVQNAVRTLPQVVRIAGAIRSAKPDLLQSTSLKADLLAVPAGALTGTPTIWHVHDRISDDYLPRSLVNLVRTLARIAPRAVIANSRATAATLPGVRHLVVAYPGFSPDQVGSAPSQRAWPATPTVGILGRISPTKGQLEFVRAAAQILPHHPDATFRIIGGPLFGCLEHAEAVRNEAQRLGIADKVEFLGQVEDPSSALDGLSLLVHASPTPEPFGQVIVEGMIRGVPVIAMDAGGATEILRPTPESAPLGWLVPPKEVGALAAAIAEALSDPAEARARAERAWASALARFPIERTATQVAAAWAAVSPRPGPADARRE